MTVKCFKSHLFLSNTLAYYKGHPRPKFYGVRADRSGWAPILRSNANPQTWSTHDNSTINSQILSTTLQG